MKKKPQQQAIPDDTAVLQAWHENAGAWTRAVREDKIKSRLLVTNQAIIDAVVKLNPRSVLDLGCGEGWLSGQLAALDIAVLGIDAIPELITAAQQSYGDNAQFLTLRYEDVPTALAPRRFDLIVCNFSLLGNESVAALLKTLPELLTESASILIQTLNPNTVNKAHESTDGWRQESWQGIGDGFRGAAPWYYRTLASWHQLFQDCALHLRYSLQPCHPESDTPASIIFCLKSDRL